MNRLQYTRNFEKEIEIEHIQVTSSYPWTPVCTTIEVYLKEASLHVPQIVGIALDHIIQGTCTAGSNGVLEK